MNILAKDVKNIVNCVYLVKEIGYFKMAIVIVPNNNMKIINL